MKPFYQDSKVTILNGHVITELQGLPSESMHCAVLSPPYWGLRDYGLPPQVWDDPGGCEHEWQPSLEPGGQGNGNSFRRDKKAGRKRGGHQPGFCKKCNAWRGSLGLEPTPELYIQHIVQVFREIWRVLRKDGTVFLNLGDSYASGKGDCFNPGGGASSLGKNRKESGAHPLSRGNVSELRKSGLKPKDLCMIPACVALALQADGWWLRKDIIWEKSNPMPESCTDRPTSSHEYIFLLTKSGTPEFWTHRDLTGTRTKPKADYRWVNQITDKEVDQAPPDWKDIIICPRCEGTGIAMIDLSCEVMGQWMESWIKDECPVCDGKKKVQKWKRINLWGGHDYFYDNEAVREETTGNAHDRGQGVCPKSAPKASGIKANVDFHSRINRVVSSRNLRSVWTIATQPFPDAHFSTFPEKLVEPCIKAGTSEKGCCPECGAPWVRIIEKTVPEMRDVKSDYPGNVSMATKKYKNDKGPESKTIGWKPSCECRKHPDLSKYGDYCFENDPIPCTVLDPFGGSGRTAIVAKKLGRKCIIIELKGEYCEMPLKELSQENIF